MLVKNQEVSHHIAHFEETFTTLCKFEIKLNPRKYAIRVISNKFLGIMISQQGIKINLKKNLSYA